MSSDLNRSLVIPGKVEQLGVQLGGNAQVDAVLLASPRDLRITR